eukprot:g5808.t1
MASGKSGVARDALGRFASAAGDLAGTDVGAASPFGIPAVPPRERGLAELAAGLAAARLDAPALHPPAPAVRAPAPDRKPVLQPAPAPADFAAQLQAAIMVSAPMPAWPAFKGRAHRGSFVLAFATALRSAARPVAGQPLARSWAAAASLGAIAAKDPAWAAKVSSLIAAAPPDEGATIDALTTTWLLAADRRAHDEFACVLRVYFYFLNEKVKK